MEGEGAAAPAARRKVLIVEDEFLVALLVEDMLDALGFDVAGIAQSLAAAEDAARSGTFDAAILDINLSGAMSYPVAEILRQRGIPFIFSTGYAGVGPDEAFPDIPALQKPFESQALEAALAGILGGVHRC